MVRIGVECCFATEYSRGIDCESAALSVDVQLRVVCEGFEDAVGIFRYFLLGRLLLELFLCFGCLSDLFSGDIARADNLAVIVLYYFLCHCLRG